MTRCTDLSAALAGSLPPDAEARFFAHAEACDACADALADAPWADGDLADALVSLDAVSCPPAVLAAVRAATHDAVRPRTGRTATDRRPAAPPRARRFRVPAAVALALVAVAAAALWPNSGPDARQDAPAVAAATDRPAAPEAVAPPAPAAPLPDAEAPVQAPGAAAPSAPDAPSARPAARREIRPPSAPAVPTPAASPPAPDAAPRPDLAAASALPDSVAAARDDLLLALALVGRAQRQAEAQVTTTLTQEVDRLSDALRSTHVF